jgi:stage IV sporulation protein FB
MGHGIMAYSLKVKIDKLTILPFGFFIQISSLEHIHVIKEFIIILFGPLMYVVNYFLLYLMFKNGIISYQLFNQGIMANNIVLIFNLLPIYPLDGHRLLSIILSFFITYKTMKKINLILSISSLAIMIYLGYTSANIVVYCYLFFMQLYYLIHFKEFYLSFIVSRMNKSKYKKAIINRRKDYFRPYDNIFLRDGKLIDEKTYAVKLLESGLK